MPQNDASALSPPSPEHRRVAVGQFERANQVIATGNYDYGIRLLLSCCRLDPANLIYRQALRRTEKTKYNNNMRGSWLAWLTTWPVRARLKAARTRRDWLKVLEHGEQVLVRNPWDTGAQANMAEAADTLGLLDLAIWSLEQARQKNPRDFTLNRNLARLYEKRGNFTQAIALWELVRRALPTDPEAMTKATELAANETIARGQYEAAVAGEAPVPRTSGSDTNLPRAPAAAPEAPRAASRQTPPPTTRTPGSKDVPRPPGSREVPGVPGSKDVARPPAAKEQAPAPTDRLGAEAARLRTRIEADPTNANGHLQLAGLYRRAGQIEQARTVLQEALGPTANDFELAMELADLEIEPFRRNLAIAEEKQRLNPQNEEIHRLRLRLMKEINTRELEFHRRKADRYPTEMAHRFELGVRLLRGGQTDEAIRELQAARSDPRHFWKSLLYLGYCFKARNNWRLARRNFEEALQNLPAAEEATRKEILFLLAQGAADAGELAVAVDMGSELANLDFTYRDIGRLLDEWQTRLQNADVSGA
jgi:tetratricopeptide (TPR) repeat protein